MSLPAFNSEGDLPPGVYPATLRETLDHFGRGSVQRAVVASRLERIYGLAVSTGHLARFVVFGSFVTTKLSPNDVDVILLMDDAFDLSSVSGDAALLFQHLEAETRFGASIFWVRRPVAFGGEQAMIEHWQVHREGGQRGIIEIIPEVP
jgi:hypothetical protein